MFSHFSRTLTCDGQTHGRTQGHSTSHDQGSRSKKKLMISVRFNDVIEKWDITNLGYKL